LRVDRGALEAHVGFSVANLDRRITQDDVLLVVLADFAVVGVGRDHRFAMT
jgi:hypothetical protein